jgi:uncharacterized protein (DUF924 family)
VSELPAEILSFWFADALRTPEAAAGRQSIWFGSHEQFDQEIHHRFGTLPDRALTGEFDAWLCSSRTALALVIVLDQFPRNLFRGSARSFAFDIRAQEATLAAIDSGFDSHLDPLEASFLYLPLEHSESLQQQERSVVLFERLLARAPTGLVPLFEQFVDYARRHRDLIARFGRFPHRNAILRRTSTPEESEYLEAGGETFGNAEDDDAGA